jgi:hypothetical protein
MNFTVNKQLTNNIYLSEVKFASFGSETMTIEEEQTLINDFGAPIIDIGGQFSGKYKVIDGVVKEDDTGETITFINNKKTATLTTGFIASSSITATALDVPSTAETVNTQALLAEARSLLFITTIKEKISTALTALKAKKTSFESTVVSTFTV